MNELQIHSGPKMDHL